MKALKYVNKYFTKYKYRYIIGVIICVLSNILKLQIPDLISKSINESVGSVESGNTDIEAVKSILLYYILLIIGVALLGGIFNFITRQMIIVNSRLIEYDLKKTRYINSIKNYL